MGAHISTEFEGKGLGSAMNKAGVVVRPNYAPSAINGTIRGSLSSGPSANKGRVVAFHSSSKWKVHFEASKSTSNLMVLDFTATWCGPCRYMDPVMNEFAAKYTDVEFIKIDVDELMDVAQEFGVHVLPTFLLIKKGKEVDKLVGANKEELRKKIEKHMV